MGTLPFGRTGQRASGKANKPRQAARLALNTIVDPKLDNSGGLYLLWSFPAQPA